MSNDGDTPEDPSSPEDENAPKEDGPPSQKGKDTFSTRVDDPVIGQAADQEPDQNDASRTTLELEDDLSWMEDTSDPSTDNASPPEEDTVEMGMDASDDELSGLTEMDLSVIGTYRRTEAPTSFESEDVFAGAPKPRKPKPIVPGWKEDLEEDISSDPEQADPAASPIPDDFFDSSKDTASKKEPSPFDDLGEDPFASLGNLGDLEKEESEPTAGETAGSQKKDESELADLLGEGDENGNIDALFGDVLDPLDSELDDDADPLEGEADPAKVPEDRDTFFVEATEEDSSDIFGGTFDLEATGDMASGDDSDKDTRRVGTGPRLAAPARVSTGMRNVGIFIGLISLTGIAMGLFTDMGYFGMQLLFPERAAPVFQPVAAQNAQKTSVTDIATTYMDQIRRLEASVLQTPQDDNALKGLLTAYLQFDARFPLHAKVFVREGDRPESLLPDLQQIIKELEIEQYPALEALNGMRVGDYSAAIEKLDVVEASTADPTNAQSQILSKAEIAFYRGVINYRQNKDLKNAAIQFENGCQLYPESLEFCYFAGHTYRLIGEIDKASGFFGSILKKTNAMHIPTLLDKAEISISASDYAEAAAPLDKTTGRQGILYQALALAQQMGSRGDVYLVHERIATVRQKEAALTTDEDKKRTLLQQRMKHLELAFSSNPKDEKIFLQLHDEYRKNRESLKLAKLLDSAVRGGCTAPVFFDRLIRFVAPVNLDLAEQYAKMAVDTNYNDVDMILLQSEVFMMKEDWESAQRKYRQAIKADPSRPEGYILLATLLKHRGYTTKSLRKLEEGVHRNPKSADLLEALAQLYTETSKTEEAKEAYEKALSIDKNRDSARTAYAMLLTKMRLAEEAVKQFDSLSVRGNLKPSFAISYAQALSTNGQTNTAMRRLQNILETEPLNPAANNELAILYMDRKAYTSSEFHLAQALRGDRNYHPAVYQRGRLSEKRGDSRESIRLYRKAVEVYAPENLAYRFTLAKALSVSSNERERTEAETLLDQILKGYERLDGAERATRNPEVFLLRGDLWKNSGKLVRALRAYEDALQIDPTIAAAQQREARSLFDLSRYQEAKNKYQKILDENPANTEANFYLGRMAHMQGNIKEAERRFLVTSNSKNPQYAEVHKTLGLLYREQRQATKSRQHLRKYLEIGNLSAEETDEVQRIIKALRF